ncbi:MAG: LytR C-terminal domain-containing protein [Candidatus Shapirobacteria bacterium]|jgi:hypothetical protein|nr:LytR C-terminal domain-containing protein [Candidatus Shapirobacteria bacterium]
MSFFLKPKVVIWPKNKSLEVFLDKKDNNFFSLDLNLWDDRPEKELESFLFFIRQNKINNCSVLIPDDIAVTKSFVYDTKIESIDKKEVIGLAMGCVNFEINTDSIEYSLVQQENKTIINAIIFDKLKLDKLKNNLAKTGLEINLLRPVSAAITNVISSIYLSEYFFVYPLNTHEYTLFLAKDNQVYLSTNFKGPAFDIQKTLNYAQLYFSTPVKKLYVPENKEIEINSTAQIEKTTYNENQIAQSLSRPGNLPLPVVGCLSDIINSPKDISSLIKPKMNNKKNVLPIIAVAILSFAIVSFIIFLILRKNNEEIIDTDVQSDNTPTSIPVIAQTPTPTIANIDKDIKIQVLNATDISGQAATIKAKLVSLGFENVSIGNATKNATENSIQVKSADISAYFESVLNNDFPATYTTDLKETATYDAVFTIGTKLNLTSATPTEAEDTTVTPTAKVTATPTEAEE